MHNTEEFMGRVMIEEINSRERLLRIVRYDWNPAQILIYNDFQQPVAGCSDGRGRSIRKSVKP